MTNDEIIKQLESLLAHCKSMIEKDGGFPIWEKDCEALEAAIVALRPFGETLTLNQLQQMNGQPVWVEHACAFLNPNKYRIIDFVDEKIAAFTDHHFELLSLYGKAWQAYASPPIDWKKWEPCEWCGSVGKKPDNWVCTLEDDNGHTVTNDHMVVCASANYCPVCGRALTEKAWAELVKRLRG